MIETKLFSVLVKQANRSFELSCISSLENPKDNSLLFVTDRYFDKWENLMRVSHCLVFWPRNRDIPNELSDRHIIELCDSPRLELARFFHEKGITNNPKKEKTQLIDGSYVADGCKLGKNLTIMPGSYIGEQSVIKDNVYIGCGVKILGRVHIGSGSVIRENTVIGADGLAFERDENGALLSIPQFGGVHIEENVTIGANVVIARGAIDDTVIKCGSVIDNCSFISHNVKIESNVSVVGETLLMGSVRVGSKSNISGNVVIRDGIEIGEGAFIAMGAVVTNDVIDGGKVKGVPAKLF